MIIVKKRSVFLMKIFNKLFYLAKDLKFKARYAIYMKSIRHIGENVRFDDDVYMNMPHNIKIDDNVFIGKGVMLNAYDEIVIGQDCAIAEGCKLISANHRYENLDVPINNQGYDTRSICLEEDVWLGYGVIVLPGVHLGKGCIVGAGSVVTKSFKAYSIVAGVPAKFIKSREGSK